MFCASFCSQPVHMFICFSSTWSVNKMKSKREIYGDMTKCPVSKNGTKQSKFQVTNFESFD